MTNLDPQLCLRLLVLSAAVAVDNVYSQRNSAPYWCELGIALQMELFSPRCVGPVSAGPPDRLLKLTIYYYIYFLNKWGFWIKAKTC